MCTVLPTVQEQSLCCKEQSLGLDGQCMSRTHSCRLHSCIFHTLSNVLFVDWQNGWKLDPNKVVAYFLKVEEIYRANPYHNKTHAADVTQTAAMIMQALDQGLLCPSSSSCSHNSNHHQEQLHLHLQPSLQPQHHHQHQDNSPSSSTTAAKVGCFARCCGGSSSAAVAPSVSSKQQEQQQPESQPQLQQQQPQSHLLPSKGCGCRRLRRVLQSLSKLEAFSIIFASAVHDLGHPGVNNAFLIKTRNEQAIIHNDRSVNENMHACLAFQLAFSSPELNIFENFSTAEFEQVCMPLGFLP